MPVCVAWGVCHHGRVRYLHIACVLAPIVAGGVSCASEDAPAPAVRRPGHSLGPTTTNAVLGTDYVDTDGRLWKCMGPAKFTSGDAGGPADPVIADGSAPPNQALSYENMTEDELAEKVRPVRLVGGYEYRLAQPDYALARKIRAMKVPPPTDGQAGASPRQGAIGVPAVEAGVTPQYVFSPDERYSVNWTSTYPASANGHLEKSDFNQCTAALIGEPRPLRPRTVFTRMAPGSV